MNPIDWKEQANGDFIDPDGWRLTKRTCMDISRFPSVLRELVSIGGAAYVRRHGPVLGLHAPALRDTKITGKLVLDETSPKPKTAPADDRLYDFFAKVTTPGCCPKCGVPSPCAYHPGAAPVR